MEGIQHENSCIFQKNSQMFSEALLRIRDNWQNNFRVKGYVMAKIPYGEISVRFTWSF